MFLDQCDEPRGVPHRIAIGQFDSTRVGGQFVRQPQALLDQPDQRMEPEPRTGQSREQIPGDIEMASMCQLVLHDQPTLDGG